MTMTGKTRDVLRATGNVLARALGVDGKANAIRSSGGLTSAAEGSDSIMVAGDREGVPAKACPQKAC